MKYPLQKLIKFYADHTNPKDQHAMEAYQKYNFKFLGIRSPQRTELNRAFFREFGKPSKEDLDEIVHKLYTLKEREYDYLALELAGIFRKKWEKEDLKTIEFMIANNAWWDSIDFIASNLMGTYLLKFPERIMELNKRYIDHKDMWHRRVAILFQLKYKGGMDTRLLTHNIQKCAEEKEFFIEKAIGWILREYSKFDPEWVKNFISKNELRPLSVREGLKWLNKNG